MEINQNEATGQHVCSSDFFLINEWIEESMLKGSLFGCETGRKTICLKKNHFQIKQKETLGRISNIL